MGGGRCVHGSERWQVSGRLKQRAGLDRSCATFMSKVKIESASSARQKQRRSTEVSWDGMSGGVEETWEGDVQPLSRGVGVQAGDPVGHRGCAGWARDEFLRTLVGVGATAWIIPALAEAIGRCTSIAEKQAWWRRTSEATKLAMNSKSQRWESRLSQVSHLGGNGGGRQH